MKRSFKELSIFIDESGDFGEVTERPSYHLVTLLFHDQNNDISENVKKLEQSIKDGGFGIEYIHTGPIIRCEEVFENYTIDDRRKLLYRMLNFIMSCPIMHETVVVDRKEAENKVRLSGRLSREITKAINDNEMFFRQFDEIIVYYDYGQAELSSILNAVFSAHFDNVDFRKAEPQKYRLLQAADFVCSMELMRIKRNENRLSNSEKKFFYKPQELKKTFLKAIDRKKLSTKKAFRKEKLVLRQREGQ